MCIKIALTDRKKMNHCLLEVTVQVAPTIRYTQDNKTPIAEMDVAFAGLRADDPTGSLKVVGWGNMAQELQSNVQVGQRLVLEGRLRMNTVPRQDGTIEKLAEFTLSKIHSSSSNANQVSVRTNNNISDSSGSEKSEVTNSAEPPISWDSSPLIPDTDDIPF